MMAKQTWNPPVHITTTADAGADTKVTSAPDMAAELTRLRATNAELVEALKKSDRLLMGYANRCAGPSMSERLREIEAARDQNLVTLRNAKDTRDDGRATEKCMAYISADLHLICHRCMIVVLPGQTIPNCEYTGEKIQTAIRALDVEDGG